MKKEELENMLDEKIDLEDFLASIEKKKEITTKLNLPDNMTIGIEIETEGEYGKLIYRMTNMLDDGWECKR